MVVELKTLKVTSDFDAAKYVAGMNAKVDADRRGAESSKATGAAVEAQKITVSSAVPLLERLSRTYVDGYGTAAKFNAEILRLAKSQDAAGASTAHLEQIYAGMQTRFGLTANATELAARGYTGLATAIGNVNARLQTQATMAERAATANRQLVAANRNSPTGFTSNLAAQGFDIGTTAAFMPWQTVALQQGPQVAQVFNDIRASGQAIGPAVAGAFMQILNPISLVTIATIGAGVAAYQYFTSGSDSAKKMNEELEKQDQLIQGVARKWGDAYPSLKQYADELERAANSSQLQEAQAAAAERRFRELMGTLDGLAKRAPEISRALRDVTSPEGVAANQTYLTAMTDIRAAVEAGRDPTDALGRATGALSTIMQETGSAAVRSYADQFDFLADRIRGASDQARSFRMQLPELGTLSPLWSEGGKLYSSDDFTPRGNAPTPDRRPLIELEGLPGEAKKNEALGRSYRDVVKSAQDRIEQMKLEAAVAGQSGIAAQRLRFELELLQDAQDKGRKITPAQREEIERLAQAYQVAAQQAEFARYQQSQDNRLETMRVELALVGQSEAVRSKTLALLQAERQIRQMGLNTSSQEAAGIREHAAALAEMGDVLDRQTDAWGRFQSAGESAIEGVVDKLTGGDFKGALGEAAKSMQKFVIETPINAPLRNCL